MSSWKGEQCINKGVINIIFKDVLLFNVVSTVYSKCFYAKVVINVLKPTQKGLLCWSCPEINQWGCNFSFILFNSLTSPSTACSTYAGLLPGSRLWSLGNTRCRQGYYLMTRAHTNELRCGRQKFVYRGCCARKDRGKQVWMCTRSASFS